MRQHSHRYKVDERPGQQKQHPPKGPIVGAEHLAHKIEPVEDAPEELEVLLEQRGVARQLPKEGRGRVPEPRAVLARVEARADRAAHAPEGQGPAEELLELRR